VLAAHVQVAVLVCAVHAVAVLESYHFFAFRKHVWIKAQRLLQIMVLELRKPVLKLIGDLVRSDSVVSSYKDDQGYIRIYDPNNPCSDGKGYIYEHRGKMADKLAEENPEHPALDFQGCLRPEYAVHHKDEDKSNNEESNLKLKKENGHKSHHFTVNNPHPTERDELGRFV